MVELPLRTKPITDSELYPDSELYEATRKELVFFMEESARYRDELTTAKKEIYQLRCDLDSARNDQRIADENNDKEIERLQEALLAKETVEELRAEVRRTGGPV